MPRPRIAAFALLAATLLGTGAHAGPWTLERGRLAVDVGVDLAGSGDEYLDTSRRVPFSLRGRFFGAATTLGLRLGALDRLEFTAATSFKAVSYTADPVVLIPPADPSNPGSLQRSVVELSGSAQGIGDLYLGASYNFLRTIVRMSGDLELKLPTGYSAPRGVFEQTPDKIPPAALESVGGPVKQDITLGDGQVDLRATLGAGTSLPDARLFLRADAGMNFRFGGPGHQAIGAVRIGQSPTRILTLLAGARVAWTINRGDPIGTTVLAVDPRLPADKYGGLTNLDLQPLYRDRSYVIVEGGAIVRITPTTELRATYGRVIYGQNYAALHMVNIGITVLAI